MITEHLLRVFRALNLAHVRYLVVGGIAVNAHGHLRPTNDIDLVIALDEPNARRAMQALESIGYRPRVPAPAIAFADPAVRKTWIEEKRMIVFQLWCEVALDAPVDVFVREPFDFTAELAAARLAQMEPNLYVPVLRLGALREMKRAAGRLKDLDDDEKLGWIEEEERRQ